MGSSAAKESDGDYKKVDSFKEVDYTEVGPRFKHVDEET
jgi:hypothetical protein